MEEVGYKPKEKEEKDENKKKKKQIIEGEKLIKKYGLENLTLKEVEELEKKYFKKEA